MKNSDGNICQSCGMPIRKIADFGTCGDGSINTDYCKFCYKEGDFLDAGISMEEKIKKNIKLAIMAGIPKKKAMQDAMTIIPRLRRWQRENTTKLV